MNTHTVSRFLVGSLLLLTSTIGSIDSPSTPARNATAGVGALGGAKLSAAIAEPVLRTLVPADGWVAPYINLVEWGDVTASSGARPVRQYGAASVGEPVALASGDFDEDGMPDLVCGYDALGAGVVTIHRGNVDALWPNSPAAQQRMARGVYTDAPFLNPPGIIAVPERAELVGTGDFDNDGHQDVVAASLNGRTLYLLRGDGRGRLREPVPVTVPGAISALVAGEINRADGLADLVVGVAGDVTAQVLVYEDPQGALRGAPEILPMPAPVTALALGELDGSYEMDLAAAAGHNLVIVRGRDRKLSLDEVSRLDVLAPLVESLAIDFPILSLAVGNFGGDQATHLALLATNGAVHVVSAAEWEPLPRLTIRESDQPALGDGSGSAGRSGRQAAVRAIQRRVRTWKAEVLSSGVWPQAARVVRAKVSSLPGDDLLLLDAVNHQLHIVFSHFEPRDRSALQGAQQGEVSARTVAFDLRGDPVAVLPMRLNADALSDLVVLQRGTSAPLALLTRAATTFFVETTTDNEDVHPADGICRDFQGKCTLRAAIQEVNTGPGGDTIAFNIPVAGVPTITTGATPGFPTPDIGKVVTIDGTTQPAGKVEVRGRLIFLGGSSTMRGLVVNGLSIIIVYGSNNQIEGNFIGTNVAGTTPLRGDGILLRGSNSVIGGTTAAAANIILANGSAVRITDAGATGNVVQGNLIGTDKTGAVALNGNTGVSIVDAQNNTIGGTTAGARNVISGSALNGVEILSSRLEASGNLVQGNLIGTDLAGTTALGNGGYGVFIAGDRAFARGNTVGGTAVGAGNVIAANQRDGIHLSNAPSCSVQGNLVGTDATGRSARGNSDDGIEILTSDDVAVGGDMAGARNVVSGNGSYGIQSTASVSTLVQGNFIGTDITGTTVLGNGRDGVLLGGCPATVLDNVISGNGSTGLYVAGCGTNVRGNRIGTDATGTKALGNAAGGVTMTGGPHTIGGTTPEASNLISGNQGAGVQVGRPGFGTANNVLLGNVIGTQVDSKSPLGNALHGVFITGSARDNRIGGAATGEGNTIAHNAGDGVFVDSGTGNAVRGNTIFSNAALGIDLAPDGPTPNDLFDADAGPNNLQNAPRLTLVMNGSVTVKGTLASTPGATFTVDFYASSNCDDSGFGEGERFLGSSPPVTTGTDGNAEFTVALAAALAPGEVVTMAATDAGNNTSELSACGGPVNVTTDEPDANLADDLCDTGGPPVNGQPACSLRAALEQANASPGKDTITFQIPAGGVPTINVTNPLAAITEALVLDGTTQKDVAKVEVDGSGAGPDANGLQAQVADVTIKGLNVKKFSQNGVVGVLGITVVSSEISGNSGAGVKVVEGAAILEDVAILNNDRGGIAHDLGKLTLNGTGNQVNGNNGIGIKGRDVEVVGVTVNDNCESGISADKLVIQQRAEVNGNGRGVESQFQKGRGGACDASSRSPGVLVRGDLEADTLIAIGNFADGVVATGTGNVTVQFAEVRHNDGSGMVASGTVTLKGTTHHHFNENNGVGLSSASAEIDRIEARDNCQTGIRAVGRVRIPIIAEVNGNGRGSQSRFQKSNGGPCDPSTKSPGVQVTGDLEAATLIAIGNFGDGVVATGTGNVTVQFAEVRQSEGGGMVASGTVTLRGTAEHHFNENNGIGLSSASAEIEKIEARDNCLAGMKAVGTLVIRRYVNVNGNGRGSQARFQKSNGGVCDPSPEAPGIELNGNLDAINLTAIGNFGTGVFAAGTGNVVLQGTEIRQNGRDGLVASGKVTLRGTTNRINENNGIGIASPGADIVGVEVRDNCLTGIAVAGKLTIQQTAEVNGNGRGVQTEFQKSGGGACDPSVGSPGLEVSDDLEAANVIVIGNLGDGARVLKNVTVRGGTICGNSGYGIVSGGLIDLKGVQLNCGNTLGALAFLNLAHSIQVGAGVSGIDTFKVQLVPNPSPGDAPPGVLFPFGFFAFELESPTGSATVTLTLPPGQPASTYYKYGPEPGNSIPHWYEFRFDGATGAQIAGNLVTLQLRDGGRGDHDGMADGRISDPGGPGLPFNGPPVARCHDVSVEAGTTGTADAFINNGSFDPDGDPIALIQAPLGPYGVGATAVTLTVTDSKGASSTCGATVTVLGSRGIKQNVLTELTALRTTVTDKGGGKKLDHAIEKLAEALEATLWVDETHVAAKNGEKVFQREKDAAMKLRELLKDKKSTIPVAVLQGLIDRLVRADRLLASVAIRDAQIGGGTAKDIRKASDELAKGDREVARAKYELGIDHYRNAWQHALKALAKL